MGGNQGWSNQTNRRLVVVEGSVYSGLFFYSPAPGAGALVGSWTAQAGTDPYGNAYPAGINATVGTISGVSFMGTNFVINSSGIFLYNGAPAAGNLIVAISNQTGTDPYGNVYHSGVNLGIDGSNQIILGVQNSGASGLIQLPTGSTDMAVPPSIQSLRSNGASAAGYDQFQMLSSENTANPDYVSTQWLSSSTDGTNQASVSTFYRDTVGVFHLIMALSAAGCQIPAGSITAVQPGTGTGRGNIAVPETWHSATALLNATLWTSAGAAQPPRFRKEPNGTVTLDGEVITTGVGPWPANANIFTLPAGYPPTQAHPFITRSDIAVVAGAETVNVLASGGVQNGQTFTAAGQRLWINCNFPTT